VRRCVRKRDDYRVPVSWLRAVKIEANGIKLPEVQTTTIIEEPSENDTL
jgi:hypothetical protein